MNRTGLAAVVGWLFVFQAAASTDVGVESGVEVEVRSASVWSVEIENQFADWSVGGIWAPTPSRGESIGEYRADEARKAVQTLLSSHRVTVESDWYESPQRGTTVRLTIDIPADESLLIPIETFEGGSVDFAVLLAWHGLALCDRTTAEDKSHADAICEAEREARRYARGMHDGGFAKHDRERLSLIDIGQLGERQGGNVYARQAGDPVAPGGSWWTKTGNVRAISRTPTAAIRDYGRSMGLPRDSSSWGH
ncbi:MAG: hypothetical protein K8J08_12170 [Thermoanaerobaculia bacterium]|nr:hypothetical protein [Thermoanaerobaculia bacterium]